MNLKSESNVNASLSSERRLKVCVFTCNYMPGKGGLRWKDQARALEGTKEGQGLCTSPLWREEGESWWVRDPGYLRVRYPASSLIWTWGKRLVETIWPSEGSGKDILLSSLYVNRQSQIKFESMTSTVLRLIFLVTLHLWIWSTIFPPFSLKEGVPASLCS